MTTSYCSGRKKKVTLYRAKFILRKIKRRDKFKKEESRKLEWIETRKAKGKKRGCKSSKQKQRGKKRRKIIKKCEKETALNGRDREGRHQIIQFTHLISCSTLVFMTNCTLSRRLWSVWLKFTWNHKELTPLPPLTATTTGASQRDRKTARF